MKGEGNEGDFTHHDLCRFQTDVLNLCWIIKKIMGRWNPPTCGFSHHGLLRWWVVIMKHLVNGLFVWNQKGLFDIVNIVCFRSWFMCRELLFTKELTWRNRAPWPILLLDSALGNGKPRLHKWIIKTSLRCKTAMPTLDSKKSIALKEICKNPTIICNS